MTKKSIQIQKSFTNKLLLWSKKNPRPLPWKGEKNPYFIWLSEVILQQTRVEQGLPYFKRFVETYPIIKKLADAPEDEVMKLWQGLGYYSRARNLHATAKHIAYNLNSVFPSEYNHILALRGIGEYTAAAISSFAFNLPHAVVDGNVYRVLTRIFGITTPIDTTDGKTIIKKLANQLLTKDNPGEFNQAIMDFGATHCAPKKPKCGNCPFSKDCFALQNNQISILPIKSKKIKKRIRFFNYLIINNENNVFLQKRLKKDIWQNLYQFPMIEVDTLLDQQDLTSKDEWKKIFITSDFLITKRSKPFKQTLTHQKIIATFWDITIKNKNLSKNLDYIVVKQKNLNNFAFPKIIDSYLQDKSLYLFK